jgi:hypothetical protein
MCVLFRAYAAQGAFLTALLPIVSHQRLAPFHGVDVEFLLLCLITVYSCRRTGMMFYQVSIISCWSPYKLIWRLAVTYGLTVLCV